MMVSRLRGDSQRNQHAGQEFLHGPKAELAPLRLVAADVALGQ